MTNVYLVSTYNVPGHLTKPATSVLPGCCQILYREALDLPYCDKKSYALL